MREDYLTAAAIVDCTLRLVALIEGADLRAIEIALAHLRYRTNEPGRITIRSQGRARDCALEIVHETKCFLRTRREQLLRDAEEAGGAP
jgi:hypothetical protein